jgi:tRNA C32,U32 (ribose-2'-O)-methylase TrmJ
MPLEEKTDDEDYEINTNEDMLQLFDRMEEVMKRLNFLSHNRMGDD